MGENFFSFVRIWRTPYQRNLNTQKNEKKKENIEVKKYRDKQM